MPETSKFLNREIELPSSLNGFRFRVRSVNDDEDGVGHDDYKTIEEARLAIEEEARAIAGKLALDGILEDGTPVTITGINRQNGAMLGIPRARAYNRPTVYVRIPPAVALLEELKGLEAQIAGIRDRLQSFRLAGIGHGQKSTSEYLRLLESLRAQYAEIVDREAVDAVEEVS